MVERQGSRMPSFESQHQAAILFKVLVPTYDMKPIVTQTGRIQRM